MLSNTAEYALRAVLYLADVRQGCFTRVDEIAGSLAIPRNYLSKILHELVRSGVLRSSRGRNGGFGLARDPASVTLHQVISRFEPPSSESRCLLGRGECTERSSCLVHRRWRGIARQIDTFFATTTVADVMNDARPASATN